MLVDPNTGMPIEQESSPSAIKTMMGSENKTFGAAAGYAEELGVVPDNSITQQMLSTVPGAAKSTMWNVYRGSRTIAYGAPGVNQISGFRATFSPKYLRQMPSYSALGGRSTKTANYAFSAKKYKMAPPGGGVAAESYTPFNALYRMGNSIVGGRAGIGTLARKGLVIKARQEGSMTAARNLANESKLGRFQLRMADYAREGPAFSAGTLARITTGDKMARGKLPTGNISNFLGETDKELLKSFKSVKSAKYSAQQVMSKGIPGMQSAVPLSAVQATGDDAARLAYASVDGAISGRVSGFMSQLRLGSRGMDAVEAAEKAGNKAFGAGVNAAERFMSSGGFRVSETAGGKFAAEAGSFFVEKMGIKEGANIGFRTAGKAMLQKGGLKAGSKLATAAAMNVVPVLGQVASAVMLADLAMDVGKLGVEVFKGGVDFAKGAAISYKGSINKGVMGMGYRDNTVAATSRARGVQAIQNSRLNARSVLGSEAGAMHAHFG